MAPADPATALLATWADASLARRQVLEAWHAEAAPTLKALLWTEYRGVDAEAKAAFAAIDAFDREATV